MTPIDSALLPSHVSARFVNDVNGLEMHLLEAGGGPPQQPLVVLLHGFPEIGYSWRKLLAPLADAGFHVVAPDQRGFGLTTGWEPPPGQPVDHGLPDWVRDSVALVHLLGHRQAHLVGHDFGSQVAASAALIRPDVFRSLTLMSAPFAGPPASSADAATEPPPLDVPRSLAALAQPRRHYQHYFATPRAVRDLDDPPQGLRDFLRAYFHMKSGDWPGNDPRPMAAWSADELAKLPTYYVMRADETMPQTVAHEMPTPVQIAANAWLTDAELQVYVDAYARTGFEGPLQFYRCRVGGSFARDLSTFAGRRIEVPACFISGRSDWGPHQKAGDLDRMRSSACTRIGDPRWIAGAGHWVQQEAPEATLRELLDFLRSIDR